MDFLECVDCSSMVPDEIFIHIFRFLELEDRQSIRLTCRHFYKLCDDSLIQSAEVITLHGTLNTVPALHCLSRSSRKIQNIKLCQMHLNTETVLPFFELHGSHVRSLNLKDCSFERGAMQIMVEQCRNLRHFAVAFTSGGFETVLNDLEDLAHNSIVCDCVTDLSLILALHADAITNQNILRFFAIFPRISKLNLDIRSKRGNFRAFDMSWIKSSDISSYVLAIADQLEVLNWSSVDGVPNDFFNIPMKNLKQLSLSRFKDLSDIPPMNSSLFEQLTHFSCSINHFGEVKSRYPLVQRLLQFTPLQSLTIHHCDVVDRQLFKALVESKLKSLKMVGIFCRENSQSVRDLENVEPSSSANKLMPNYCLQHLVIDSCDRELVLLFATYFRSVNFLTFRELNERVLQNILNDQTTLRHLHFITSAFDHSSKELSYFQDCLGKVSTMNRELRYLTELQITEENNSLACFFLDEIVLPKLKKLSLVLMRRLDEHYAEQLFRLIPKFTQLHSLNLFFQSEITYQQCLGVCKGLTKLRHFNFRDSGDVFTSSEYIQLFDVSPSLRTVKHFSTTQREPINCFYDVIEKIVIIDSSIHTDL